MVVTLSEFSPTVHRYVAVSGSWKLGGGVFGPGSVLQEGVNLKYRGPLTLIGRIRFEWFAGAKLLGSTTRATSAGHPDDAGAPAGFSAGACTIS
jgi:hypothetical protein